MNPVLVIGDTGLLGQALLAHGTSHGMVMRGASRHSADIMLDASNAGALSALLTTLKPQLVINAAGLVDIQQCEQSPVDAWLGNTQLPDLISRACAANGVRFVHVSTDHYYTGDGMRPHAEDAPVKLLNEYARSKYAGECLVLTEPSNLVIRTNIVGFRGWANKPTFVEWLISALKAGTPVTLFDDFYTSSIAASQFAALLFGLLQTPAKGIINLACREGCSKQTFAYALAAACGLSVAACKTGSVAQISGAPRANSLVLDITRAEEVLGYTLPDLSAVIQQLADEYRHSKAHGATTHAL